MSDVLAGQHAAADVGGRPHTNPNTYTVFVAYNGIEKPVTANAQETVQALLNRAIQEFHVSSQPHILSLFNQAGVELPDAAKVAEVGIRPDDHLLLRPSKVKGGAPVIPGSLDSRRGCRLAT
jgi:hypothetical protein